MKSNLNTLFSLCILAAIFGCNSQSSTPATEAVEETQGSVTSTSEKSFITEIKEDTDLLATREWTLPQSIQSEWSSASTTTKSDTVVFDSIDASFIVQFTVLSKDTSNFIIKDAKVSALTKDNNYVYSSFISEQANMGSKKAFNTYSIVTLTASRKPGVATEPTLESKAVLILPKKGIIQPL